jgi:hypothetical protein
MRRRVFERDGGRCRYCGLAQFGQAAVFHVNHIIPRSKGGPTEEANLALQCPHCSLRKADKTIAADPEDGSPVPLYHPLRQKWEEHFRLDVGGLVHGKTPTGRATIEALRMNDSLPRIARSVQIRLGLLLPSGHQ